MQSGMRIDVKGLPVGMQEQAALKLAKEIAAKAGRVAGRGEGEAVRDWCEVCTRWSECDGVDDQCPWKGRE